MKKLAKAKKLFWRRRTEDVLVNGVLVRKVVDEWEPYKCTGNPQQCAEDDCPICYHR